MTDETEIDGTYRTTSFETKIVWDRIHSTVEEMFNVTQRLSFSTSMSEAADLSNAILTRDGDAVDMSERSTHSLTGVMSYAARNILRDRFELDDLNPGDVVIANDPWISGGHLQDVLLLSPIHYEGDIIGFAGSLGHVGDIGGRMGGWATDTEHIYEEGFQIPPTKLYRENVRNETVTDLLESNVRVSDQVLGDVEALRSANELGIERIRELVDEYSAEAYATITEDIIASTAESFRAEIDDIDDGQYEERVEFEAQGHELEVRIRITVDGETIRVDYTGASDQVDAGINSPLSDTRAITAYILKCMIVPKMRNSEGIFKPLEIVAPEGSILNATRPHSTDARLVVKRPTEDGIIQAMGQAIPDSAVSGIAYFQLCNFAGTNADGEQFMIANSATGPMPARSSKDGISAKLFPSNGKNKPVEIFEKYCPLRVTHNNLVPDTEGEGEFRSGFRLRTEFHNPTERAVQMSITSINDQRRPHGFDGGNEGKTSIVGSSIPGKQVPAQGRMKLRPGETVIFKTAVSGGYGNPELRDDELVKKDLNEGWISPDKAAETYNYDESEHSEKE